MIIATSSEIRYLSKLPKELSSLTFSELFSDLSNPEESLALDHPLFSPIDRMAQRLYKDFLEFRSLSGSVRLLTLIQGERLTLFLEEKGELLDLVQRDSSEYLFESSGRLVTSTFFPNPLFEGITALLIDCAETSLIAHPLSIGVVRCWIVPQPLQEVLINHFFLSLNPIDHHHRTLLHHIVQAGLVANGRALISSGIDRDAKDLDGRTPLHTAVFLGDRPMVEMLLEMGCHSQLETSAGETLLHIAAAQSNRELLLLFLDHPSSKEWLHRGDLDGKIPLHHAVWKGTKPEITHLLINAGTDVNATSHCGYTSLHWAAQNGHFESARLLLRAGARIDLLNQNGESPLDLALQWEQNQIIWLLIAGEEEAMPYTLSSSSSSSLDSEGIFCRSFQAAHNSHHIIAQLFWLQKLAQIYVKKKDYITAAHLLNSAHALAKESIFAKLILNQLERLERLFLFDLFQKTPPPHHSNYLASYRDQLLQIRLETGRLLEQGVAVEEIQSFLTHRYQDILTALINESIYLAGEGDFNDFAVMGLGSMARMEVSPYSDLEFAFLTRTSSLERHAYFQKLGKLLTLKMINMGETEYKCLRSPEEADKSIVPSGFSMDIGGLCPSGKSEIYELIGTPQQLAELQTEEWMNQNSSETILVHAMTTVSFITGDGELIAAYQQEVNRILDREIGGFWPWTWRRLRQDRALKLMRDHLADFQPRLNQDKVDLGAFDIKNELYRLPQMIISALALYHCLISSNTLTRIEELRQKGVISHQGGERLKRVLKLILKLRIKAHLFYKKEQEILFQSEKEESFITISPEIRKELIEIYRTLIPLYEAAQAFVRGGYSAFTNHSFYDQSIDRYDDQFREGLNFNEALSSAERAFILNPDSSFSHWGLGRIYLDLEDGRRAVAHFEQNLLLFKRKHGAAPHSKVIKNLGNLGWAYYQLGEYLLALKNFNRSLAMSKELYGESPNEDAATTLNNIGNVYFKLSDYRQAIEYNRLSLKMRQMLHGKASQRGIAMSLNDLGNSYASLGKYRKAIRFYKDSLKIKKEIYQDSSNPIISSSLDNLGKVYASLGDYHRAIEYHTTSLEMSKQIYKERPHPHIANSLGNLGIAYNGLKEHEKAIELHHTSLSMKKEFHGDLPHSSIAASLICLGETYYSLGNYYEAINYHKKSLSMNRQLYGDRPHFAIAKSLIGLGNSYKFLIKETKALSFIRAAHEMFLNIVGADHPETKQAEIDLALLSTGIGDAPHQ